MFGAFRFTNPLSSGLLWKTPWRLSKFQKRRQRLRLRAVDSVVATLDSALAKKGETTKSVERWKAEMPKEEEMRAKDKYTIFDRKEKRYRKGIHSTCCHWGTPQILRSGVQSVLQFALSFADLIVCLQSCPSGRGCLNGSTLLDTRRSVLDDKVIIGRRESKCWEFSRGILHGL